MSDTLLTERDEDGAATNPGTPIPAAIDHSPDTHETTSQRASYEPRQNDASAHFRSSVPRPVDASFRHQVQPPVLRQGDTLFGQNQRNLQPPLSAMTSNFLPQYPPSYDGNRDPYGRPIYGRNAFGHTLAPNASFPEHAPFGQNQRNLQPPLSAMTSNFLPQYPPSYDGNRDPYGRPIYGRNAFGHTLAPNPSFYPPQFYSNVPPSAWPSFNEPYAKEHMNSWNHAPDSYQPQSWNGQYPSPNYFGNHYKNFYQGAPGQLWIPPSQNSHVYLVTSMSMITRSKKPSNSERAPSNTPPQPRKPRSHQVIQ